MESRLVVSSLGGRGQRERDHDPQILDLLFIFVLFLDAGVGGEWAGRQFIWETRDGHGVGEAKAMKRIDGSTIPHPMHAT